LETAARGVITVDDASASSLLVGIARERLTGFAVQAVVDGRLVVDSSWIDDLFDRHEAQLALDLQLERLLCAAAIRLDEVAIPYRALKGPVLANTVYREPALRSFGDIDMLVDGRDFDHAVEVFSDLEFSRRFVEPRPHFDARFSKGSCLERGDGMEIDLHRTLAPGAYGMLLGRENLFSLPARIFELGDTKIAGVDHELALVHACFHAVLGDDPPRFVPMRDVAELSQLNIDAGAVIDLAKRVGCGCVLRRAAELVESELSVRLRGLIWEWSRGQRPSRFDRWALSTYSGTGRSYARQSAASVWALPGFRERVAYATALAFPSRDYLRARGTGRTGRLCRSARIALERPAR
jgi:hypothetical protein